MFPLAEEAFVQGISYYSEEIKYSFLMHFNHLLVTYFSRFKADVYTLLSAKEPYLV